MSEANEKQTVLVVDDTAANIDLLSNILSDNYKVKVANNGRRALAIAAKSPHPDLILLDIMMPEMDGYEVCRQLKDNAATADIPIIFITAKTTSEDEKQGFALGAVDYIVKPFNPVIVEARVRSQLALQARSKRLYQENVRLKEQAGYAFRTFCAAELEQLVDSGESDGVEFKSTLRVNLHTGKVDKKIENVCLKTVAAFLNSAGGMLLIGVDDAGCSLGLASDGFKNEDKLLLHWNNLFNAYLGTEYAQYVRAEIKELRGENILLVQSLMSPRPVFFARDNEEVFYIRTGNSTQQLKPSEILAYIDQRFARKA